MGIAPFYQDSYSRIFLGSSLDILPTMKDGIFHSCVTDPPYEIGLLGRQWDSSGIAYNVDLWRQVYRTLRPGAHLAAFGSPRAYHRMAVAIEDAGFEIRDTIMWIHGQGMPKGNNIGKSFDKVNGAVREPKFAPTDRGPGSFRLRQESRASFVSTNTNHVTEKERTAPLAGDKPVSDEAIQWDGWNTNLNPAYEPIVLARKPFTGTLVQNIRQHETGAINVDGARYSPMKHNGAGGGRAAFEEYKKSSEWRKDFGYKVQGAGAFPPHELGRYPTNVLFDEESILELDRQARLEDPLLKSQSNRFYFTSKASVRERERGLQYEATQAGRQNNHLTVKPLDLMQWLVRLITPKDGLVLDPFLGSGTTRLACKAEHMRSVGIELEEASAKTASARG